MLTSKRLVVLAGAIAMGFSLAASAEDNAQLFDPSRGVIFTDLKHNPSRKLAAAL